MNVNLILLNSNTLCNFLLVRNLDYMSISNFFFVMCYAVDVIRVLILITFPIRFMRVNYIQNSIAYARHNKERFISNIH